MTFYCDNKRHLVCIPYSIENLHLMAETLKIGRHWFHKNHYDIPKRRIEEITAKCNLVNSRNIVNIIKGVYETKEIQEADKAIEYALSPTNTYDINREWGRLEDALTFGFNWDNTDEKGEHWYEISESQEVLNFN